MIDASRSPRPVWKRVLTVLVLVVSIAVAAWVIWVKELHHPTVQVHAFSPYAGARPLSGDSHLWL